MRKLSIRLYYFSPFHTITAHFLICAFLLYMTAFVTLSDHVFLKFFGTKNCAEATLFRSASAQLLSTRDPCRNHIKQSLFIFQKCKIGSKLAFPHQLARRTELLESPPCRSSSHDSIPFCRKSIVMLLYYFQNLFEISGFCQDYINVCCVNKNRPMH